MSHRLGWPHQSVTFSLSCGNEDKLSCKETCVLGSDRIDRSIATHLRELHRLYIPPWIHQSVRRVFSPSPKQARILRVLA